MTDDIKSQSTQSGKAATSTGTCSVCFRTGVTVVSATGSLWRHDPHGNPCTGSGGLPQVGSVQTRVSAATPSPLAVQDVDLSDGSSLPQPVLNLNFNNPPPSPYILNRIPKGARNQAANVLTRLIRCVLIDTNDLLAWERLLGFPSGGLVCPNRGGRSRNLTTLVVQQIQRYDSGAKNELKTTGGGQRNRKQKIGDEAVAKRVSAKLEDGYIKGTLRVLMSNDSLAPYTRYS